MIAGVSNDSLGPFICSLCNSVNNNLVEHFIHDCRGLMFERRRTPLVRLPVLLCAVKTVEGDFRFCWTISPNVGQTDKENPNLVRIFYMICTLNDI